MNTYAVEAVHRDEGSIVVFEGWELGQTRRLDRRPHDTTTYLIAVGHRMAQAIVDDLEGGEPVIVFAENWQIVGTIK
jgi:hypothetical protein